jgi:uncharacterized protein (DUF849 family)
MVVTVALTGAVPSKRDNTNVPLSPVEIAEDAVRCADAGASVVHVHVRDEEGTPVHRRDLYEEAFDAIRAKRPDLVICATTSSRVGSGLEARLTALDLDAELRPDMASLTLGSFNFPPSASVNPPAEIEALLARMRELGVRPEFEVFELGMVNTLWSLAERDLVPERPVVNVLLGSMGSAPAFVGDLAHIVGRLPGGTEWAAAGIGIFQRPMVIAAAIMGGNVRTGLEDNPSVPDHRTTNVDAVELAVRAAELAGRPVASVAETRRRFGLPAR